MPQTTPCQQQAGWVCPECRTLYASSGPCLRCADGDALVKVNGELQRRIGVLSDQLTAVDLRLGKVNDLEFNLRKRIVELERIAGISEDRSRVPEKLEPHASLDGLIVRLQGIQNDLQLVKRWLP
jgi:hypothetical protein